MKKIISTDTAHKTAKTLKDNLEKIILVGGCFDILHAGHIKFLNESKSHADKLLLLLESDENIKKFKGPSRPINTQDKRASILSSLSSVDFIILLKGMTKNEDYDKLIVQIKPEYMALTKGDKNKAQRVRQCKMVGAKLIEIDEIENFSSTDYINNL